MKRLLEAADAAVDYARIVADSKRRRTTVSLVSFFDFFPLEMVFAIRDHMDGDTRACFKVTCRLAAQVDRTFAHVNIIRRLPQWMGTSLPAMTILADELPLHDMARFATNQTNLVKIIFHMLTMLPTKSYSGPLHPGTPWEIVHRMYGLELIHDDKWDPNTWAVRVWAYHWQPAPIYNLTPRIFAPLTRIAIAMSKENPTHEDCDAVGIAIDSFLEDPALQTFSYDLPYRRVPK